MDPEKVSPMSLSEKVVENFVDHDVVSRVPPVRGVIVDSLDVQAQASEECDEAVGPVVRA